MKNIPFKFELITAILIALLFFILQPKLSVVLFPQKRQTILHNFIEKVKKDKTIDARSFWQFREFYYPGYFTFERLGFQKSAYENIEKMLQIKILEDDNPYIFLIYSSNKFKSIEALVTKNTLNDVMTDLSPVEKETIFQNNTSIIYTSNDTMRIFFVKPQKEMVKANGYFDYKNPRDMAIVGKRFWLSISEVTL